MVEKKHCKNRIMLLAALAAVILGIIAFRKESLMLFCDPVIIGMDVLFLVGAAVFLWIHLSFMEKSMKNKG